MIELKGEHKCFLCGRSFNWQANMDIQSGTAYSIMGCEAEATAIGRITTSTGPKVQFEIKVKCPNCRTFNKFSA